MAKARRDHAIVLDVGGTSIKSSVITAAGQIVDEPVATPIDSGGQAETILSVFGQIIQRHLVQIEPDRLAGLAFGMPGPFDYERGISYMKGVAKYEALYGLDFKEAIRTRLELTDCPILFRNDAEAAIVGEVRYGAGQNYRRLIGITLGTGIGSCFIVDGWPVTTGPGVPPHGWLYAVPFEGTLANDHFSIHGLQARLQAANAAMTDIEAAAEAARQGEAKVQQVFTKFGADLGRFLQPFVAEFQAEVVLVLGGIANALDLFGDTVTGVLTAPLAPGQLGARSALFGAAELLFRAESNG